MRAIYIILLTFNLFTAQASLGRELADEFFELGRLSSRLTDGYGNIGADGTSFKRLEFPGCRLSDLVMTLKEARQCLGEKAYSGTERRDSTDLMLNVFYPLLLQEIRTRVTEYILLQKRADGGKFASDKYSIPSCVDPKSIGEIKSELQKSEYDEKSIVRLIECGSKQPLNIQLFKKFLGVQRQSSLSSAMIDLLIRDYMAFDFKRLKGLSYGRKYPFLEEMSERLGEMNERVSLRVLSDDDKQALRNGFEALFNEILRIKKSKEQYYSYTSISQWPDVWRYFLDHFEEKRRFGTLSKEVDRKIQKTFDSLAHVEKNILSIHRENAQILEKRTCSSDLLFFVAQNYPHILSQALLDMNEAERAGAYYTLCRFNLTSKLHDNNALCKNSRLKGGGRLIVPTDLGASYEIDFSDPDKTPIVRLSLSLINRSKLSQDEFKRLAKKWEDDANQYFNKGISKAYPLGKKAQFEIHFETEKKKDIAEVQVFDCFISGITECQQVKQKSIELCQSKCAHLDFCKDDSRHNQHARIARCKEECHKGEGDHRIGYSRVDKFNWTTATPFRVIRHELGHHFGLGDEYSEITDNYEFFRLRSEDQSFMNKWRTGEISKRHFSEILRPLECLEPR